MPRPLLFEIGAEEVPSAPLYAAAAQMKALGADMLAEARLAFDDVVVFASPRRVALYVPELAEHQEDQTLRARGPAVKAAFDAEGRPTRAAEGFARSKGVDVASLERGEEAGGEYVFAVIDRPGRPAADVLPELLAGLVAGLDWPKSMRWGDGDVRFSRPVRWLLALFGTDVVPVEFAGLRAGTVTFGHRFLSPGPLRVATPAEYERVLEAGKVVAEPEARSGLVREGIEAVAERMDARAVVPERTFAEVVNLVEWPTAAAGRFDEAFLEVPREVLETAMESHQRYFPLEGADGRLLNAFVVVHNGDPERTGAIVAGHERVIRARLADAAFFYAEDRKRPLEEYVARLDAIVFQDKLGTLGAKVGRVERLAAALADRAGSGPEARARAVRAAHLAKADLVTHVVVEFPSLQGVMGRYYAAGSGESAEVAEAIVEHYRPRFAGDAPPASEAGRLVSAADKLDTIVGIFAAGLAPTGSADPYALRRSALGILAIVVDGGLPLTLDDAVAAALDGYGTLDGLDPERTGAEVKTFFLGRFEGMLRDRGHAYDTVDAVLAVAGDDPADAVRRCEALTAFRGDSDAIEDLSVAFTRARNLGKPELGVEVDESLMGPEEHKLLDALRAAETGAGEALAARDYPEVLARLASVRGPVDEFFDKVLVMDPDERLRDNRLRLLNRFTALFSRFADFSKLAG